MIESFSTKDLQNMRALLTSNSTLSFREILSLIDKRLNTKKVGAPNGQTSGKKSYKACPSCGKGKIVGLWKMGGLKIARCSKKCGYSEVIA